MRFAKVLLAILLASAALVGKSAPSTAQQAGCRAMLNGAPESVMQLEAVRSCHGAGAACAYVHPVSGYGVLTLMCPATGIVQVLGAERLRSLRFRNGTLAGDCSAGSWRRDVGLPSCYP
jgi:hypothetical protein